MQVLPKDKRTEKRGRRERKEGMVRKGVRWLAIVANGGRNKQLDRLLGVAFKREGQDNAESAEAGGS